MCTSRKGQCWSRDGAWETINGDRMEHTINRETKISQWWIHTFEFVMSNEQKLKINFSM